MRYLAGKGIFTVFFRGPGNSSGKALDYGLDGPGSIPGVRGGGDFSSLLRVQTGPGVHPASYKMSTEGFFSGVKAAERRTSHPSAVAVYMWTLASTSPVGLHGL